MLDHYYSERTGPKHENQSMTEFKFCTHGSEVHTGRDKRGFFFARSFTIAALPLTVAAKQNKKHPLAPRVVVTSDPFIVALF